MPQAEKGIYTCEELDRQTSVQHRTFDLQLVNVIGSHNEYLLEGETLELTMNSSDTVSSMKIEWFGPRKTKVKGSKQRWTLENNDRILRIRNLTVQEDNGMWECHILPSGPILFYDVKVIGFLKALDVEMMFAAVNSSVILSYELNANLQQAKRLPESSVLIWKPTEDTMAPGTKIPVIANSSYVVKNISNVHFENAGWYQCQLKFRHGYLNKTIHLVVMKVSAQPIRPLTEEGDVTLCCQVSAPFPPMALLRWEHMNDTKEAPNPAENKFCFQTRTVGLWNCRLLVKNELKISLNYTVEKPPSTEKEFPLLQVVLGAGVPLLLLILTSVFVAFCKIIKQKRQRARRMVLAKQHLLAKRTCQCQKSLTNDYYHA
ncbi:uncharacterized protein LOC128342825 [Hemicordylus capensis]|uniref:uncharacterized protein LOC128342825 n=1 Tax=Hemicordylus capensis TaxID=884348 RepID=UPI002304272C|nr:uncharacterized protein LOC128342825 [Hemicordylus capensis]